MPKRVTIADLKEQIEELEIQVDQAEDRFIDARNNANAFEKRLGEALAELADEKQSSVGKLAAINQLQGQIRMLERLGMIPDKNGPGEAS